ncbi:hypothetical protein TNIN_270351 [Trichonephila inaurata madagascariensis]|uniref:Uncharacterized protein n=1 Tax=Trichonephila inaurata madagascariensis TaxID=2747483 RepID=A0A8X7BZT9_9ARAC|nr:hypothetical protein TNIN_270351 [Trichonephila inaurata madagascariensis]
MKLLYLLLLSVIIYQNCTANPVEENTISEDTFIENGTAIENWYDFTNRTNSNESYPEDMHGFSKKIKDKVKDIKDKVKDKVKTFKDKIGDGFDKVKEKLKNLKDKIGGGGGGKGGGGKGGGGGGGGGGGNYRPYGRDDYRPYDRDNNRPYDRDYYKRDRYIPGGGGSGGSVDGTNVILIVFGIIFGTGVVVGIIYYFANR